MAPYYLFCIEQFGANRCMFESNFPVDKLSYSYPVLWNALKQLSKDFSPTQRAALFHDTATQTYRLATRADGILVTRRVRTARASRVALTWRPFLRAALRNRRHRVIAISCGTRTASRRAGRRCVLPSVTAMSIEAVG
jgi:hypothetical protein